MLRQYHISWRRLVAFSGAFGELDGEGRELAGDLHLDESLFGRRVDFLDFSATDVIDLEIERTHYLVEVGDSSADDFRNDHCLGDGILDGSDYDGVVMRGLVICSASLEEPESAPNQSRGSSSGSDSDNVFFRPGLLNSDSGVLPSSGHHKERCLEKNILIDEQIFCSESEFI